MFTYNQYSMRPIEYEDLKMILDWRNSERIHSVMLTDHKITWEEHSRWFEKIKNNPVKFHFVFEYESRPVGYIGYSDVDREAGTCAPGLYIGAKEDLPPEAGIIIYYMSTAYAFEKLGMKRVDHFTFKNNVAAMAISGSIAGALTTALGETYIGLMEWMFKNGKDADYLKSAEGRQYMVEEFQQNLKQQKENSK